MAHMYITAMLAVVSKCSVSIREGFCQRFFFLSHAIHRYSHTEVPPSSSYLKPIRAWSPSRIAKGPAEAIWAARHLCAKGAQSDMSVEGVRGNLETSDLERREEAMYLPTPASKEELNQELFSWSHGLKEIKFLPSLRPDGPQTHLFFKDMCVILGINMSALNRSRAIPVA